MPKQYVLCGRLLPPITTRRITVLVSAVVLFVVFSVIFTLPSGVSSGPSLSKLADHKFSIPTLGQPQWKTSWPSALNPFRPKSHAPPRLDKDSHEGASWFADWSWLSTPFSSTYTLDEDRALLPPLPMRAPIYCYYDTTTERQKEVRDAESALLLTWRRAWWAHGFQPVILSAAEAMNNPRYEELQRLKVSANAKNDIMRWLAWEIMGGGLLSHFLVLPMAAPSDPLLSFLRRGEYPELTRWEGLGDGLFAGSQEEIAKSIQLVLANPLLVNSESFLEAIPPVRIMEPQPEGAVDAEAAVGPPGGAAAAAAPPVAAGGSAPVGAGAAGAAAPVAPVAPVAAGAAAGPAVAPAVAPAAAPAAAVPVAASPIAAGSAAPVAAAPVAPAGAAGAAVPVASPAGIAARADAVGAAKTNEEIKKASKDFPFKLDSVPASLAYYNTQVISSKYAKLGDTLAQDRAAGLRSLNQVINAHLHITWQNTFTHGIAVVKPQPAYMTHLVSPAVELANRLAQCSVTPLEASCPPNNAKCQPCVARTPMVVHTPPTYRNKTTLFTIGMVPHPYTFQSVAFKHGSLDVPWLRRKSQRDAWLHVITRELLGTGVSSARRVLRFKEAVAGAYGRWHTLWVTAEQPVFDEVDWRFGFIVPMMGEGMDNGHSSTPVPGPERLPPVQHDKDDGPVATEEALAAERELVAKAKRVEASKDRKDVQLRSAVEAWNLGDMEAWKFARAYAARARAERLQWEREEAKYANGVGSEKGRRDSRFWD